MHAFLSSTFGRPIGNNIKIMREGKRKKESESEMDVDLDCGEAVNRQTDNKLAGYHFVQNEEEKLKS